MPALIFPAPGYTAVDSSSILSTATWCSSDSLGAIGKLKTQSTIVASTIKLDVPKVSSSRKLTTNPVNFTPSAIKQGFRTKSVDSRILTTSTNRLESTVNTTTFVYTQTSVITTLIPTTPRERLYYAQLVPGKYGQILTYNGNKVIDVVSSQLKTGVLSKPISILRPDTSSRTSISLLAKPITVLRPDNTRAATTNTNISLVNKAIFGNKLPRAYTTSSIKAVNIDIQLPITGQSGFTADTVSWYINDQDILTVVSLGTPLVTLYFARSIYAPVAGSTVKLINSNIGYSKQISVISATDGSITFTDPGDFPSISSMYIATVTSQNIVNYVTTVYLDNSTKIFDTPSVAKIKTVTSLRSDSKRSIGVENTNTKFSRLESTINTTTFVYTQTSVSTTLAPTTPRGRLYYAQVAPGKYGQIITYNGTSITQGIPVPGIGKTANVAKLAAMSSMVTRATLQKPVALLKAGDIRVYSTNTNQPLINKVIFGKKIPRAYTTATVRTITTDVAIPITGISGSPANTDIISWYINDQDILTVISQESSLITLYFDKIIYPVTGTITLSSSATGYNKKISVISSTDISLTFSDPGDLPGINALSMIISISKDIIDYSTVTYLDNSTKIFDIPGPYKLSKIDALKADTARISSVGKTNSVTRLINKTTINTAGNLQKPVVSLRPDSSYSSTVYVGTDTTQIFYDTVIKKVIRVTTTARSSATNVNNLVDWIDDETNILVTTDITPAVPLLTVYIDGNNILNPQPTVQIRMETVSARASLTTTASIVSYTANSITIVDPGEIPSPIDTNVWLHWTTVRSVITTTITSNNTNKIALVNKATFGSRIPRTYTTSTMQTVSVDTVISVIGRSGSTADTVSWYINDQDILTIVPQGSELVTLYFIKQPRLYFTAGSSVKLFNYLTGYSKQITVITSTDGSITFADPEDIPSTSGLQLVYTETQTVFRTVTNSILENGIEIFDAPTASNLVKPITVLKADSTATKTSGLINKPIVSLRDGPPLIPTPGKVTSAIVVRPDNNQRSVLYTTATGTALVTKAIFGKKSTRAITTATTRTVTTDIAIPVTGMSASKFTADTVNWYINDQDILTVVPVGASLITFFFANSRLGSNIRITNGTNNYIRSVSAISITNYSITFTDPGDLPGIGEMYILSSTTQNVLDYQTYAYLDSGTQMFDVPNISKLSRVISVKADPAQIQTIGKAKIVSKLVPSIGVGIPLSLQKQFTTLRADNNQRTATYTTTTQIPLVNKATFGGRFPRAYTTSTTIITYIDTPWPITGRSGSTADTVNWYINDQDILTTTNISGSTVTLYFAQQNLQTLSSGLQIRLVNWVIGYTKLVTLTAATNASITFVDPGDLPSISGMNILLSVPKTVTESSSVAYYDSSNKIFDIPTSSTLIRSSKISKLVAGTSIDIPANLQKPVTALRADNNQRSSIYNTATQISLVNKAIFGKKLPRAYTTSSTFNLVTTDVQIPVISRTGSTADTVSWYINDQDILTVIPVGSALITFYFARPADNVIINNSTIKIINSNIGYSKQVSIISKTENSVTFADPGDLPSISNMFIIGTTSQYVIDYSTVTYLDSSTEIFYTPTSGNTSIRPVKQQLFAETVRIQTPGKTSRISKLIAGTNITTSASLQKQFAVLKADNNQRTTTFSTATQAPLVTKVIFGKKLPRAITTATTRIVTTDISIPITGISGSTADTVNWYINDQDILTVIPLGSALVTLYFAKISYVISGTIKLTNTNIGYFKSISVISSTDGSITFTDPGDLPSISGMYIIISTTQSVIDYQTYTYLDSSTQMFDVPRASKLSVITQLKSDSTRIQPVGRTSTVNKLIGKTSPGTSGNLQKPIVSLRPDSSYPSKTYVSTDTTQIVYDTVIEQVIRISTTARSGISNTNNLVDWLDDETDILVITNSTPATPLLTLYIGNNSIVNPQPVVKIQSQNGDPLTIASIVSFTPNSITIVDPGTISSPIDNRISLYWTTARSVITASLSSNDLNKNPLVNKITFGSRIPRAYTTSTTSIIYVDTPWPVTGRSGSTADTVNWYINDQDILNTTQSQESSVTLYFAQQNLQTLSAGLQIRLLNWIIGYTKLVTLTAATNASITFVDPGDLPSISGLSVLLSVPQTIVDNSSITRFESSNELINTPKSGNLSKSLIVLRAESTATKMSGLLSKPIVKLASGPSIVTRTGKVTSAIALRPDNNQRANLYTTATGTALINKAIFGKKSTRATTTATTRTVTTDIVTPVIGISASKYTADTVNWYINDQDILTVSPVGPSSVTFFFANSRLGSNIRITNGTSNYIRSISAISLTNYSITFADPGDLPGIGEMYILSSTTQNVLDYQTYAYLDSGNQMFDIPRVSKLSRAISVKADSVRIQTPSTLSKNTAKLVSAANVSGLAKLTRSLLIKGVPFTSSTVTNIPLVNKAIFGKRVPRAYTSATTRTIYTDIQISVTGITGSTADTVSWYINDQDILTVISVGSALVTLYFAKQNQNYFSVGSQVRVFNSNIGYNQLVTLTSFTDGSITFVDPGNLPSISGMYVIATQSQNIIDYITISNLDYSTSIFSIPTVNSLIKSQIQIRSPRTISSAYTLTNTANRLESTVNTTTFVYTQTSVTTTLSPNTARERLYYAQMAPGRYGQIITYNGSSIAPGGILSTSTNRLESTVNTTTFVYTQTSVTTTLAPTTARERLYYAQLAPGKYGVTFTYNGRSIAPGGILSTSTSRLESTVNTTTFVYTQTSVITTLAPTTARERLYYAQLAPGKYGVTFTYNGKFLSSGLNVPATDALQQRARDNRFYGIAPVEVNRNLEFFNDTDLPGEISFPVRYQLTNVLTTSNSIESYIYDYDILTYSTYQNSPLTRTFLLDYNSLTLPSNTSTNASYIPFVAGSTVKISSKKTKYANTFTVVQSNYNSVTVYDDPSIPILPEANDVVISGLPSVYPIALISTNKAPVTARENLYYFNISPGLRSGKNLTVGEALRTPSAAKLTPSLVVKALPNNLSASVTGRVPIKLSSDSIRLTVNRLTQAATRLKADRSSIIPSNLELIYFVDYFSSSTVTTSTFVVPTASIQINRAPQSPREVLYYALMGPGIRNGGITLTAFGKQIGDANAKLPISTINKNISPLKADTTKIIVGKTSIPSTLVGRFSVALSGNLQKALQVLKADSSYPTKSYTAVDTSSTVYASYSVSVTGISRNLSTADTVAWYINDQDILTVTPETINLITLYFIPSANSMLDAVLYLSQPSAGYSKIITSFSYTNSSITFVDPTDLPDISGMTINWSRSNTVISTTITGQDNNKIPLVNKAIFGKKLPQASVSSVTKTIDVDASIPITAINRPGPTADTVNWYINDTDILTTSVTTDNLVTLFFNRQNLQIFSAGDVIRLADYNLNYIKQVTLSSATSISVTFTDPGDLVSTNNLKIIVSSTQTITDFQTTTYLDSSTKIFESPTSSNLVKSSIKLRPDTVKLQTISGKIPFKLADSPPLISKPGKVISTAILRPDSSYSSPIYTSTSTTSVVYDSYYALVTSSSETGVTTDVVSWYIDDQDILTVSPFGSKLLTLFFDPIQDSLSGLTITISHGPTNYYRVITNFTSTRSSITFLNPGDIFSTNGMILTWSKPRTVVTATAIGQNLNKIPLVNRVIFGKKLPRARISTVTRTIDVDTLLPVIGRSSTESTADTANWYLNDQDILSTSYLANSTVTIYLDKQNIQTFTAGSQIRLANYRMGYIRQFTVISATDTSITFNDPGDLPEISSLNVIVSVAKTVTDFQTDTYLENTTEVFESPKSSNLVKSLITLRPDPTKLQTILGKVPFKVVDGPPNISKSLANLQKSLIQLRPDSSYSSPTYTSTSTTSVTYDNYSVAVIGSDLSTANTVAWYIEDRDVLNLFPTGSSLITLYFTPGPDSVAGVVVQLVQNTIGYTRTITSFTYTSSSITFLNPGDLPSTGGMTINWSRPKTTITATAIGQDINKIPLVTKAIFGKKLPRPRTVAVTNTIYVDSSIPILAINKPTSTANTVAWYIEDRDILTTTAVTDSTTTLIFARQTLKQFTTGEQIRLADYSRNYVKQVTVIFATDTSVTFTDPGDLVFTNNLNILVSVAQTVTDSQTTTYLDSSIEIFDTPKISNLAYKQLVQLKAEPAVFKEVGKVKIPLKLIPTGEIFTTAKLLTFAILKADRNKLVTENLSITGSRSIYKLTDDVSIKLVLGRGQIIKLHTGNFKLGSVGIQDPAAQKKEPIQFWN